MAAADTDTAAVTSGAVAGPRRRGNSKAQELQIRRAYIGDPTGTRRSDDSCAATLGAAVGRRRFDCGERCRATRRLGATPIGRPTTNAPADPKALRDRLGLSREGIAVAAKNHIEASGWIRDHLTKAVGLHQADEVWQTVDRHLFADASGRRHGPPRIGSWWDFTRIPGRARSHTKTRPVWETWRLVGTLDGHLDAYRHPHLPTSVSSDQRRCRSWPARRSWRSRPGCRRRSGPPSGSWWDHDGAFAVVFTGLPGGDLVLPVRLPQGAGQWAHLAHFLADPSVWHKIDLVRVRDRKAPGGWRYYAHLLIHQAGYQSAGHPGASRRHPRPAGAPGWMRTCRTSSLASFPDGQPEQLVVEQIACTDEQQEAAARAAKRARARQKALDRSRRNTNPDQYGPSARQHKRGRSPGRARVAARQASLIRAGRGMAAPMGCRCALTATTGSRAAISAPEPNMSPRPAAPVGPNTPAPERSPRGSWPLTATPSPSRTVDISLGRGCGASGSRCSAPACWWPPSNANATRPAAWLSRAGTRIHCAVPALPVRGAGAENPRPAHP